MDFDAIEVGQDYVWLMPYRPDQPKRRFRFLQPTWVTVVAKTSKRIQVQFTYQGKTYERTISAVNLLAENP